MGLQHYTQDMSKITLKYHKRVLFYTKYTHPMLICGGTDARTDARTENIYSIFRDKLLLLGKHGHHNKVPTSSKKTHMQEANHHGIYSQPRERRSQWQGTPPIQQMQLLSLVQ
jgi:hypothetical protein